MQMKMQKRVNAGNFYRECEMFFAKNLNLALATVPPMARRKVHTLFSVPSLFSVSSWALSMFDLRSKIFGYAQTVVCLMQSSLIWSLFHGGRQVMSSVSVATSLVFLLESNRYRSIACPSLYLFWYSLWIIYPRRRLNWQRRAPPE